MRGQFVKGASTHLCMMTQRMITARLQAGNSIVDSSDSTRSGCLGGLRIAGDPSWFGRDIGGFCRQRSRYANSVFARWSYSTLKLRV
jgi:hypothetical protein